jgi:DNA-binding transcriptional ArsR family regulator
VTSTASRLGPRVGTLGPQVLLQTGTAFELLTSTLTGADPQAVNRFEDVERWAALRAAAPRAGVATIAALGPHPVINLLGLVLDSPPPWSAARFVAHLATVPALEIVRTAVGRYRRTVLRGADAELIDAAVAGDAAARKRFMAATWPEVSDWQQGLKKLFSASVEEVGSEIRQAIEEWHRAAFAGEETRLAEAQTRERESLLREEASGGPWRLEALLRRTLPTVDYVPPAGVETAIFVPTAAIRPSFVFLDHRMDALVIFPVAPSAPAGDDSPPERLVLIGKALGDPLRLRALRELADGPLSIGDLASRLGIPRTSLGHHVGVLRAAGLIGFEIEDGRYGRLSLRADAIDDVEPLFRGFVTATGQEPRSGRSAR